METFPELTKEFWLALFAQVLDPATKDPRQCFKEFICCIGPKYAEYWPTSEDEQIFATWIGEHRVALETSDEKGYAAIREFFYNHSVGSAERFQYTLQFLEREHAPAATCRDVKILQQMICHSGTIPLHEVTRVQTVTRAFFRQDLHTYDLGRYLQLLGVLGQVESLPLFYEYLASPLGTMRVTVHQQLSGWGRSRFGHHQPMPPDWKRRFWEALAKQAYEPFVEGTAVVGPVKRYDIYPLWYLFDAWFAMTTAQELPETTRRFADYLRHPMENATEVTYQENAFTRFYRLHGEEGMRHLEAAFGEDTTSIARWREVAAKDKEKKAEDT